MNTFFVRVRVRVRVRKRLIPLSPWGTLRVRAMLRLHSGWLTRCMARRMAHRSIGRDRSRDRGRARTRG